jgi:replicative DNA helicase
LDFHSGARDALKWRFAQSAAQFKPDMAIFQNTADPELAALKMPPHSVEAEQSVLGGLLLENHAWDRIADVISQNDFYRHDHKLIYRMITKLIEQGKPADVVTVAELLENHGELSNVGGLPYLVALAQNTPSAANIRRYAEIVRERGVMRKLVEVGTDIAESAYNPAGRSANDLLDQAEAKVFDIAESGARSQQGFLEIKPLLTAVVERIDELFSRDNQSDVTGIPTGFADLDQKTAGLQPGDLIIVAGRPSMGKTAFSINMGENVAIESGLPVAIFSMEMGGAQLVMRMLGSIGRLDQHKIRTGRLQDDDWQKLTYAVGKLNEAPIFIDETPALNALELRARARRLHRQCGKLGMIIIDYLQLMSSVSSGENRATEISEISRSLKALAKELQVPVVALSQLNRSLEQRPNKRPVMSDLRESGAIEQDADVILFIYRDEVYNPDSQDKGSAEIIIGKQRNGPIGTVRLTFLGEHTRFENYASGGNY